MDAGDHDPVVVVGERALVEAEGGVVRRVRPRARDAPHAARRADRHVQPHRMKFRVRVVAEHRHRTDGVVVVHPIEGGVDGRFGAVLDRFRVPRPIGRRRGLDERPVAVGQARRELERRDQARVVGVGAESLEHGRRHLTLTEDGLEQVDLGRATALHRVEAVAALVIVALGDALLEAILGVLRGGGQRAMRRRRSGVCTRVSANSTQETSEGTAAADERALIRVCEGTALSLTGPGHWHSS